MNLRKIKHEFSQGPVNSLDKRVRASSYHPQRNNSVTANHSEFDKKQQLETKQTISRTSQFVLNNQDKQNGSPKLAQGLPMEKRFFMTQHFSPLKFQASQKQNGFTGVRARSEANILKDLLKSDEDTPKFSRKASDMYLDGILKSNFKNGDYKDNIKGVREEDQEILSKLRQTDFVFKHYSNALTTLPRPLNLIDQISKDKQKPLRDQNLEIKIGGQGLSDFHAPFLVEALRHTSIKSFEIQNNNFKDKGVEIILHELINQETKSLNLSFNTFTYRIMESFEQVLSPEFSLRVLNLEGNKLGDAAIEKISRYIQTLEVLNISNNSITNLGAIYIQRMLKREIHLKDLNLQWNRINGIGGRLIAESLFQNTSLKILNLASNSIGIGDKNCGQVWANMLSKKSKSGLIHLDLSYNRFDATASQIIANEFNQNTSILGFHFKGNNGEIDSSGKLFIPQKSALTENELSSTLVDMPQTIQKIQKGKFGAIENCWICEGWQEKNFVWNPNFSGPVSQPPIFIHFNFDDYRPHQMRYINEGTRNFFSFSQMVPPNMKILYFFTAAGNQLHAKDQQRTFQEENIVIHFADQDKNCSLSMINFFRSSVGGPVFDEDYQSKTCIVPRREELKIFMPKQQELEFKWNLKTSFFEESILNTRDPTFVEQCFDFDWKHGVKLSKIVREIDQLEKVRQFYRAHYSGILSVYKHYASLAPCGEVWCWNQQTYQQFVVDGGIFDGRYFKLKDSLLCFIQANNLAETKTHPQAFTELQLALNPENCLIRYEIMELLTIISIEKYLKPGLCTTLQEAVETIFQHAIESLLPKIPNPQEWRETKLYTEKCDNILKLYNQLILQLFSKYSKRREPKDYMGLYDFRAFLADFKLFEIDEITVNSIFNSSIPLQIDELNKQYHMLMNLTAFTESIGRIADFLSLIPFKTESDSYWTTDKCSILPLHIKLEAFIQRLLKNSNNKSFQQEFDYQQKSLFMEDIESIKNGKAILEKTRKLIQKKVVGTISTIMKMRGKKEKSLRNIMTQPSVSSKLISIQSEQTSNACENTKENQPLGPHTNDIYSLAEDCSFTQYSENNQKEQDYHKTEENVFTPDNKAFNVCSNFQTLNSLQQISRESTPFRDPLLINPNESPNFIANTEPADRSILAFSPKSVISQTESLPEAPIVSRKNSLRNQILHISFSKFESDSVPFPSRPKGGSVHENSQPSDKKEESLGLKNVDTKAQARSSFIKKFSLPSLAIQAPLPKSRISQLGTSMTQSPQSQKSRADMFLKKTAYDLSILKKTAFSQSPSVQSPNSMKASKSSFKQNLSTSSAFQKTTK